MAQIDGAGQQDTDNQNAEALQAALAQREVTLQGQPQGGGDVPSHENSDPVSTNRKFYAPVSLLPENVVYRGSAQTIRAILLASATRTSIGGLRASMRPS